VVSKVDSLTAAKVAVLRWNRMTPETRFRMLEYSSEIEILFIMTMMASESPDQITDEELREVNGEIQLELPFPKPEEKKEEENQNVLS
jgi:hypothetical protein